MHEPMAEPFEPYEPYEDDSYDWDVDEEPRDTRPMNVRWGRVAILGGVVLVAFLFGRATKSSGVPEAELTAAQERVQELRAENEDLRAENASQQEALQAATTTEEPVATTEEEPAATDTASEEDNEIVGETYKVKSGDTLRGIAQTFYGDPELADYLAEVNNIDDPTAISVGMTLIIPEEPPE